MIQYLCKYVSVSTHGLGSAGEELVLIVFVWAVVFVLALMALGWLSGLVLGLLL